MNRPTPMPEEPYFFACEIGAKTAQFRRLAEVGGTVARRPRTRQRATWSAIVGNGEWGTGNRNEKAGGGNTTYPPPAKRKPFMRTSRSSVTSCRATSFSRRASAPRMRLEAPSTSRPLRRRYGNAPVAKRSGWVSAKRELRSSRKAPRPRAKGQLFQIVVSSQRKALQ